MSSCRTIDSVVDGWANSCSLWVKEKLRTDPMFFRDMVIGFFLIALMEIFITVIRPIGFMYREGFWDYEFVPQYLAIMVPSAILTLFALLIGIYLFGVILIGKCNSEKQLLWPVEWIDWFMLISFPFIGVGLIALIALVTEDSFFSIEMIFLSFAYFARYVASTRKAGLAISAITCLLLCLGVLFHSFFCSASTYKNLLSKIKISNWTVEVVSLHNPHGIKYTGCLLLLGPNTAWLKGKSSKSSITALNRQSVRIDFVEPTCNLDKHG